MNIHIKANVRCGQPLRSVSNGIKRSSSTVYGVSHSKIGMFGQRSYVYPDTLFAQCCCWTCGS